LGSSFFTAAAAAGAGFFSDAEDALEDPELDPEPDSEEE